MSKRLKGKSPGSGVSTINQTGNYLSRPLMLNKYLVEIHLISLAVHLIVLHPTNKRDCAAVTSLVTSVLPWINLFGDLKNEANLVKKQMFDNEQSIEVVEGRCYCGLFQP